MAITGTGTEQDPYLVHNYDEMKEACEYENYDSETLTYGTNYVKLVNDIDCNDYGADWDWETIELASTSSSSGHTKHYGSLNLDGHTIKNVYIKTGQYYMFKGHASSGVAYAHISNGKILNVFLQSSSGFFKQIVCNKVSFSGNYSTLYSSDNAAMNAVSLNECAFYLESSNPGGPNKMIFSGSPTRISNSDIEIHIDNCTNISGSVVVARGTNEQVSIENSRITGDLTGSGTITGNSPRTITNIAAVNSIFEIDINGYEKGENVETVRVMQDSPTSVINDAKLLPWMTAGTTIAAPSSEAMRSASALNALGFTVVPRE